MPFRSRCEGIAMRSLHGIWSDLIRSCDPAWSTSGSRSDREALPDACRGLIVRNNDGWTEECLHNAESTERTDQ